MKRWSERNLTTAEAVGAWLKATKLDALALRDAHAAAEAFVSDRLEGAPWSYRYDPAVLDAWGRPSLVFDPEAVPPAGLVMAVNLETHRLLARRNTPEGVVGMGEYAGRIPATDADVAALLRPWRPIVFG